LLRNPRELDGEGLGKAATAAARAGLDDDAWWGLLSARARELAPALAMHDVALILNGMARSRRLDRDFVDAVLPRICASLVYLTSAHLAMISSAVAKAEVSSPRFVALLTRELKARLVEFHSSMEITMIINAMSKLRVTDEDLYRRLASHVQNRAGHGSFHVRELSVIVGALARVHCTDVATLNRFADCAIETLPEATPTELARLMQACMSVSCSADDFFTASVMHCKQHTKGMDPSGLSGAAFAFGQCFEVAEVAHLPYLRQIFRNIRFASVASLPLFPPREIVSLLRTYARWQVTFECDHLRKVADRMRASQEQFDVESSVAALYSLALLLQRNSARSTAAGGSAAARESASMAATQLLGPVWSAIRACQLDALTIVRAVEAHAVLRRSDYEASAQKALASPAVRAVSACIAQRRVEFDAPTRSALYELLGDLGCYPQDDVMLVLAPGVRSAVV